MLRFLAGVLTGIYIEQEYPGNTPPLKPVLDGILRDAKQKVDEYQTDPKRPKSSSS